MNKRILALMLVVILSISMLAGCGGTGNSGGEDSGSKDKEKVVSFVTDIGGIDDKSFNQSTWEGVARYADEKKWTKDQEFKFIQSNQESDYIPNLSLLAEEKYKLVIAAGFLFNESIDTVAQQFPETKFVIIDTVVEQPNVASVMFAVEEGSFLAGIAAARNTKTQKVAFVGGMDSPSMRQFQTGFEAGVYAIDPSISVTVQWADDFTNPSKGQTIASTMYEQGIDVIFQAAGGTGNGIINEAKNRVEDGEKVWVIGVDKDQYADGLLKDGKTSAVLTSMLKRVDNASYLMIQALQDGKLPVGKTTPFTLKEKSVGIPENNPNLDEATLKEIKEYSDKIVAGEINVPATVEELDAFKK